MEEDDENVLFRREWISQRLDFLEYIEAQAHIISKLVRYHLTLAQDQVCTIAQRQDWIEGTFNICIPISVSGQQQRLLLRCPLPHRFSPQRAPGLVEEKLRTEAASYAWISRFCAGVPIPILRGVGLPNGLTFTPNEDFVHHNDARQETPWCPFTSRHETLTITSGYLLMDFIEKDAGETLASKELPPTPAAEQGLLRSLAKVILDISRPLERIGAFWLHDSGKVALSSRPLTSTLAMLENDGIPTLSRANCYTSTVAYFTELLDCHDSRLRRQPDAVRDKDDAAGQMAVVTMLRSQLTTFTNRDLRQGPFVFQLTDLNPGNIFVDDEYKVTAICDLEWGCSLPLEMFHPPRWLSGHSLDDLLHSDAEERKICNDRFDRLCERFAHILAEERETMSCPCPVDGSDISSHIRKGSHFYLAALRNPRIAYDIFMTQIQPLFAPEHTDGKNCILFQEIVAPYYCKNSSDFIDRRVRDRESYITLLQEHVS